MLVVYKQAVDATLYVIGGAEENEIMLYLVVVALRHCLDVLLRYATVDDSFCGSQEDTG
jgi:coatomer subunit zeta